MILSLLASLQMTWAVANPLELHLRSDTGIVQDAKGRVVQWKDISGRGASYGVPSVNASLDSSLCPAFLTTGTGGRPSVVFAGRNALQDTSSLPLDSGATIFIVALDSTAGTAQSALFDKGQDDLHLNLWNGVNFGYSWTFGDIATSNTQASGPALFEASWDKQIATIRRNGSLLASASAKSVSTIRNKSTWLGADDGIGHQQLGYFLKGTISEVRVYRGVLADSARKQIADSLMTRYGLRPEMMLYLRADTGVVRDEKGRIVLWKDLSSRGASFGIPASAGRPDSSKCPTWRASGIAGKPSIHFSGANALMDTSSLPLDSGATILIVAQDSGASDDQSALLDKGDGDLHLNLWSGLTGNLNFGISWRKEIAISSFRTTAPALYEASYSSTLASGIARLYANGALLDSGNVIAPERNRTTWIGADHDGTNLGYFLKGDISEIRVYRGRLNDSERIAAEAELITRYRIGLPTLAIRGAPAGNASSAFFLRGEIVLNGTHAIELSDVQGRRIPFVQRQSAQGEVLSIAGTSNGRLYLLRTNQGTLRVLDTGN